MTRQPALAALLIVVCSASAASGAITNMFGPLNPAVVDTNGLLTAEGAPAIPNRTGTFLFLSHPWSTSPATGTLCSFDPVRGKYLGVCRTTAGGLTQSLTITGFSAAGFPNQFAFNEIGAIHPQTGTASLVDQNHDGIWDGLQVNGRFGSVVVPFVYVDTNSDGFADFISIPWSFAPLLGLNPSGGIVIPQGAGGPNPQVWIPLADTNGDGKGDAIVLDLTGSGSPDPDLFMSPAMGPVPAPASLASSIPTLSEWGMLAVILGLTSVALLRLRTDLG